jgi:hypothetical protein
MQQYSDTDKNEIHSLTEEIGKPEPKQSMREKLTNLFSFHDGPKGFDSDTTPKPGTPPTFDEDGSVTDPGNPFIGPINPKVGYPTEGYSGKELRRIKRAQTRRENAEQRVATRNHNRARRAAWQHEMDNTQREAIRGYEIPVPEAVMANLLRDQDRIDRLPTDAEVAVQRQEAADQRKDRLDDRREARFRAGKPRGKDLREDIFNEYESLLPKSSGYNQGRGGAATNA